MSEHALFQTNAPPTSSTSNNAGASFFVPSEARSLELPARAGARPYPFVDEDQEPETSPETRLADSKDVITLAFGWVSQHVEARLSALEKDLRADDEVTFGEQLLHAAFRTALSAATAGISEHLAGLVVGEKADALRELVKSAIENGLSAAGDIGAAALRGSKEPLAAFIEAQKSAARYQYQNAQKHWLRVGRHQVRTQPEVDALEAAFNEPRMQLAAERQYDAARDAWIAYLAQLRFGVRHSKALDEDYDIVELGPTTDLTPSTQRERTNERQPGFHTTEDSPDIAGAFLGAAPGVLVVEAELPAARQIDSTGYFGIDGTPR